MYQTAVAGVCVFLFFCIFLFVFVDFVRGGGGGFVVVVVVSVICCPAAVTF